MATDISRQTRTGGVAPGVPEGRRVYAVGDIHGRADLLDRLHEIIAADLASAPERAVTVVYLGDYVDRGADSRGVIDILTREPLPVAERLHLKGNHEELMLAFLDGTGSDLGWMMNGAGATMASYGVAEPDGLSFRGDFQAAREALRAALPAEHRRFLRGLALTAAVGDYLFVHAGIRPGVPLDAQAPDDLIWIREEFLHSEDDHGMVVVHGHTPAAEVQWRANRIGIDTLAYASNRLTSLVLEGAERRLLHT